MRDGEDDEGRGRAIVPTPNSMVRILYFSHLPNVAGRGMPLLAAFLLFQCNEEGHIPLLIMSFLFQHSREGHAPSLSCHSHFNTARRDVPSSLCLHFTSDRQRGVCPLLYNLY